MRSVGDICFACFEMSINMAEMNNPTPSGTPRTAGRKRHDGNNLENLKPPGDLWKVRLIDEDFRRLMFKIEVA